MAGYYGWTLAAEFDEERELKRSKVWLCDVKEVYRCPYPFENWMCLRNFGAGGMAHGAIYFSVPTEKFSDWLLKDGWNYFGVIVTTEEERKEREPKFREMIRPWIDDFGKEWGKCVDELMGHYNRLKAVDVEKANDLELQEAFRDWLWAYRRMAQIHFIAMYAFCCIERLFEELCMELLGIDRNDPLYIKLMSGFDNKTQATDGELWRLGDRAKELGLEETFKDIPDDEQLLSKLEESEAGRKWLQELREFVDEYGWRTRGNWDTFSPSWVEKPSLALTDIRRDMATGGAFVRAQAQQRLRKERAEAEKEVLSRLPEDKREWFDKLMRAAQWAGIVAEEHVFYTENYGNATGRRIMKEIEKRFVQAGIIDEPLDVHYLSPDEIDREITIKADLHKLINIRKKQHEEFRKAEQPPFIGDPSAIPEMLSADPVVKSTVAAAPRVRPELKADLYGTVSAPGIVEGIARVVMSEEEFDQVQTGEILVAVETSAAWTPLFARVKAVVADVGGVLAHAYIVGREYGLPVVSGTLEATKKIKTGDRIRVDGDLGVIHILGK